MPYYHSLRQIRRNLNQTVKDFRKKEFILGYLEGSAEHKSMGGGSQWWISNRRLNEAFKKLAVGKESAAAPWRQVKPGDIAKIQQKFPTRPAI